MTRILRKLLRTGPSITAAIVALALGGQVCAQENVGKVSQPLVGGTLVSLDTQEEFGLLSFHTSSGSCSASLLRNGWAITAAHCVEVEDRNGRQIPDPARPGQFMLVPVSSYVLKAAWSGGQTRKCDSVQTFRPYDVALLKVSAPFEVNSTFRGYTRNIFPVEAVDRSRVIPGVSMWIFGRGINQFATGSGASAMPSQSDGRYRMGEARASRMEGNRYWYPSEGGRMIAGGDSGGPSFAKWGDEYALVGVHSLTHADYAPGHAPKPGDNPWMWVTATPEAADAPIAPVWRRIVVIMDATPSIGYFGKPASSHDHLLVLYGMTPGGDLSWFRKNPGAASWRGPRRVGSGWNGFKAVIAAGGNCFYVLTGDGRLLWYQHKGFNDGSFEWNGPEEVKTGWRYNRIFSGGEGIIYAIRNDGALLWFRHGGYVDGSASGWEGPRVVGSGWGGFKSVGSSGKGVIYAVKPHGELLRYQHLGYANGDAKWQGPRTIGSNWQIFRQVMPLGDGVLLAIRNDGKLVRFRDLGPKPAKGLAAKVGGATRLEHVTVDRSRVRALQSVANKASATSKSGGSLKFRNADALGSRTAAVNIVFQRAMLGSNEQWEGPQEIGSGWQAFDRVIGLLPGSVPVIH